MVVLGTQLRTKSIEQMVIRRRACYSRRLLTMPRRQRLLERVLVSWRGLPLHISADGVLVLFNRWLRTVLHVVAPQLKSSPRKPWVKEDTFDMIRMRANVRASGATVHRRIKATIMSCIFKAWHAKGDDERLVKLWGPSYDMHIKAVIKNMVFKKASLDLHLWRLNAMVVKAARRDKAEYIENIADEAQKAAEKGDIASLYRARRKLAITKKPAAVVAIRDQHGERATSHHQAQLNWKQHF